MAARISRGKTKTLKIIGQYWSNNSQALLMQFLPYWCILGEQAPVFSYWYTRCQVTGEIYHDHRVYTGGPP